MENATIELQKVKIERDKYKIERDKAEYRIVHLLRNIERLERKLEAAEIEPYP